MKRITYTFLFIIFFSAFSIYAKEKGFPGTEMKIFKIVLPSGKKLDPKILIPEIWLKPIGRSKQSVINVLGNPDYFQRDTMTQKEYLDYNNGPSFVFAFEDLNNFDSFGMGSELGISEFILSQRFQIRPGMPMPQALLDNCEYTVYTNPNNTATFVFDIVTPNGELATSLLHITIQNNNITTIYYGYSE